MPSPSLTRWRAWRVDTPAHVLVQPSSSVSLPRLARAADALTVTLLIVAAAIAWSGGFRETWGEVRLIVTSWLRIAVVALAVAVTRHVAWPAPALPVRLAAAVRAARASTPVRTVVVAVVATRLIVLVAGYLASVSIAPVAGTVRFRDNTDTLSSLAAKWDAQWYVGIVRDGYSWDGNRRRQQNVVFFPALPMAMYAAGLLLGKRWVVAGVVVAILAFGWGLWYLFRLARDQLGDRAAVHVVWLIATYPFAVYFSAPYTEALYLLGSVATLYHVTRGEYRAAVGWGLLTGLCRPNGFLLVVPLTIIVFWPPLRAWLYRERVTGPGAWAAAATLAPLVGLGLYSVYLWSHVGDPMAWQLGQFAWGRRYVGIWAGLEALFTDRWSVISRMGLLGYAGTQPMDFMNASAAVFVLAALVPLTRRLGLAYGALVAVNLFPPLLAGGMMSIGRMTSVMFPVFLWLGGRVAPERLTAWITVFAVLQGVVATLFFTWRPAF